MPHKEAKSDCTQVNLQKNEWLVLCNCSVSNQSLNDFKYKLDIQGGDLDDSIVREGEKLLFILFMGVMLYSS